VPRMMFVIHFGKKRFGPFDNPAWEPALTLKQIKYVIRANNGTGPNFTLRPGDGGLCGWLNVHERMKGMLWL